MRVRARRPVLPRRRPAVSWGSFPTQPRRPQETTSSGARSLRDFCFTDFKQAKPTLEPTGPGLAWTNLGASDL